MSFIQDYGVKVVASNSSLIAMIVVFLFIFITVLMTYFNNRGTITSIAYVDCRKICLSICKSDINCLEECTIGCMCGDHDIN